jgi:hypothetical protein
VGVAGVARFWIGVNEPLSKLEPASSVASASWLVEKVRTFAEDMTSLVPEGFEAYARVLHPATSGYPDGNRVTWAEIAATTGRTVHAEVQWPHLAFTGEIRNINDLQRPPDGAPWRSPPEEGSLDLAETTTLVGVLREHTTTPERCWFGFWEGWGGLRTDIKEAPWFELPSRGYFLMEGPIDAITTSAYAEELHSYQSASLWWPEAQAWCVATDVDLESTYIGASAACIDELLSTPGLEVLRVEPTHGVTWAADEINPNPLRLDGAR